MSYNAGMLFYIACIVVVALLSFMTGARVNCGQMTKIYQGQIDTLLNQIGEKHQGCEGIWSRWTDPEDAEHGDFIITRQRRTCGVCGVCQVRRVE